jgi:hypothetical protein
MLSRLGQALGFIRLVASLLGGALMLWMFFPAFDMIMSGAAERAPGGYGGMEANRWLQTGANQLPIVFLLLGFFGFIALAVFQRRYAV